METNNMRVCVKCGKEKAITEYNKDSRSLGGYTRMCKSCNQERRHICNSDKIVRTEKYCPKCKVILPINSFGVSVRKKDGHDDYCKKCRNVVVKESQLRNKRG